MRWQNLTNSSRRAVSVTPRVKRLVLRCLDPHDCKIRGELRFGFGGKRIADAAAAIAELAQIGRPARRHVVSAAGRQGQNGRDGKELLRHAHEFVHAPSQAVTCFVVR